MILDYIIVGAGIAGSTLAYKMLENGLKILVIDELESESSTKVAAGLINPVTGKYLAATWKLEELWPVLFEYYSEIEKKFNSKLLFRTGMIRPFSNEQNKTNFLKQISKHQLEKWIQLFEPSLAYPLGGLEIKEAAWLDTNTYLEKIHAYFLEKSILVNEVFQHEKILIGDLHLVYGEHITKGIVFCEGYGMVNNPFFKDLPLNPVKGEILDFKVESYSEEKILNQGKWIIPLEENLVRIGSTYNWHNLDNIPSQKARFEIEGFCHEKITGNKTVQNHKAGVRPSTSDRRPLLGTHATYPNLHVFNGLGTKGVSLAPYFADEMLFYLTKNKQIDLEANIDRFNTLY
jgi:glycine/D-amino acid oxidase-like deaminating enzyme